MPPRPSLYVHPFSIDSRGGSDPTPPPPPQAVVGTETAQAVAGYCPPSPEGDISLISASFESFLSREGCLRTCELHSVDSLHSILLSIC